ncbi:hypothetical protein FOL47_002317 [Perkinsus chesapeaki]|uniref:Uncharacterized protein n=1 Tax=Perkinsus chesapeaki TaxID=330153 RepID=A0A7J6MEN6_PERCH|nr:hypothetical protein FOL47_002317 [Perkinsus chesapeaki]
MSASLPHDFTKQSKSVVFHLPPLVGSQVRPPSAADAAQWDELYRTSIVRGLSKANLRSRIPDAEMKFSRCRDGFGMKNPKQVIADMLFARPRSTRSFDSTRPQTRADNSRPSTKTVYRTSLGSLRERPQTCNEISAELDRVRRPSSEVNPSAIRRGSRLKLEEWPFHKEDATEPTEAAIGAENDVEGSESDVSEVASINDYPVVGDELERHMMSQLFEGARGSLPSWYSNQIEGEKGINRKPSIQPAERCRRRSAVVVNYRTRMMKAMNGILDVMAVEGRRGQLVPDFVVWWLLSLIGQKTAVDVFEAANEPCLPVGYVVDSILIPRVIGNSSGMAKKVGRAARHIARQIRTYIEEDVSVLWQAEEERQDATRSQEPTVIPPLPRGDGWPPLPHNDWVEAVESWRALCRQELADPATRTLLERSLQVSLWHGVYCCVHPSVRSWATSMRSDLIALFWEFADWPSCVGGKHMSLRGLKQLLQAMGLYPGELPEFIVGLIWKDAKCLEKLEQVEQGASWSYPSSKRGSSGRGRSKKKAGGDPYKWITDTLADGAHQTDQTDVAVKILDGLETFTREYTCAVGDVFDPFAEKGGNVPVGKFIFACDTYCNIKELAGIEPATFVKALSLLDSDFNPNKGTLRVAALDVALRRYCHAKMRLGGPRVPEFRRAMDSWDPLVVFGPTAMAECLVRLAAFRMRTLGNVVQRKAAPKDYCAWLEMLIKGIKKYKVTSPGFEPPTIDTTFSAIAVSGSLSEDSSEVDVESATSHGMP